MPLTALRTQGRRDRSRDHRVAVGHGWVGSKNAHLRLVSGMRGSRSFCGGLRRGSAASSRRQGGGQSVHWFQTPARQAPFSVRQTSA